MKQAITLVLVFALLLSAWSLLPGVAVAQEPDGGTESVMIRTADDLAAISGKPGTYVLENDIDLGGKCLTSPIATLTGAQLNGNGHAIYGYTMESATDIGLFAIEGDAVSTVKNLTIGLPTAHVKLRVTEVKKNVGVVCGNATGNFQLENLFIYADIEGAALTAGGMVGMVSSSGMVELRNCVFYGSVKDSGTGDSQVGGMVGRVENSVQNIVIDGCVNHASLNAPLKVGGIASQIRCAQMTISGCTNYGNLNGAGNNDGGILGEYYLAGSGTVSCVLRDCANYGNVSGAKQVGGILGYMNTNSKSKGGLFLFEGCINYGEINGSGANVGGIIGGVNAKHNITVKECANFGNLSGGSKNRAGICGCVTKMGGEYTFAVTDSLNAGNMISSSRAAGAIGELTNSSEASKYVIERFISLGTLTGASNVGGVMADAKAGTTITDCIIASVLRANGEAPSIGFVVGKNADTATASGNRYFSAGGNAVPTLGDGESAMADWVETLQILNRDYSNVFGPFMLNNSGNGIVRAKPKLSGVAETPAAEGAGMKVRLIASLSNTLRYSEMGFYVSVNGEDVKKLSCHDAYQKVFCTDENGLKMTVSASGLGGSFLYAQILDGISVEGDVVLTVMPYAIDMEKRDMEYLGVTYTLHYRNGVYHGTGEVGAEVS